MRAMATALCALLLSTSALAQQPSPPPAAGGMTELSPQAGQALAAVSRNAVAAQQFGNLATTKQAPAAIRELGARMVMANSAINDRLDDIAARHGMELPRQMPVQDQQFFEALAETNRDEFARGLIAWVAEVYPETIRALQAVAGQPGMEDLAQAAIPQLRDQLRTSQQFARDFMQDTQQSAVAAGDSPITHAGGLLAAIANPDGELRQLRMTSDLQPDQVHVVPAQRAVPSGDVQAVRRSVAENRDGVDRLRQAIGQEDALAEALRGNNVSPRDVIAMDVMDDGVILYTMDTQQAETPEQ